jgi:hypothetical protein
MQATLASGNLYQNRPMVALNPASPKAISRTTHLQVAQFDSNLSQLVYNSAAAHLTWQLWNLEFIEKPQICCKLHNKIP